MDIVLESALEKILEIGVSVIVAVSAAAGAAFVRWITSKTKNEKLSGYAELLDFYAQKAVKAVAQTQANVLKAAALDGKLTDGEKEQLKKAATDELKKIAPNALLDFHAKAKSDIDSLLSTLLESAVYDTKEAGE